MSRRIDRILTDIETRGRRAVVLEDISRRYATAPHDPMVRAYYDELHALWAIKDMLDDPTADMADYERAMGAYEENDND